jgi:hypothetical protein
MVKWTEQAASPAEYFPHAQGSDVRNVELPRAKAPDGSPLVVSIRRLDAFDAIDGPDQLAGADARRHLARQCVLTPRLFEANGAGPIWASLHLLDQMAILEAIAEFNSEGMGEAAAAAAVFPPGDGSGAEARGSGDRPGGDQSDASREPAAPADGEGASAD